MPSSRSQHASSATSDTLGSITYYSATRVRISLTDIVLRAVKTLVLGKRIKIHPRILVAASGRSCLTISFNICTITCAVASYVHYMISFNMCRHFCAKFVIWLQMPLMVLEFFTLLLVLHIQHVVLVSRLCRFKRSLLIFSKRGFFFAATAAKF